MMNDLNFFSQYIEPQRSKSKISIYPFIIATALVLAAGGTYYWSYIETGKYNKQIDEAKSYIDLETTNTQLNNVNDIKKKLEVLKKYNTEIVNIKKEITKAAHINSELINTITTKKPSDIFMNEIVVNESGLEIKGIAKNNTLIAELQHNITQLNLFKVVHVINIKKESETSSNSSFELKCSY